MSACALYCWLRDTSGAMYPKLPILPVSCTGAAADASAAAAAEGRLAAPPGLPDPELRRLLAGIACRLAKMLSKCWLPSMLAWSHCCRGCANSSLLHAGAGSSSVHPTAPQPVMHRLASMPMGGCSCRLNPMLTGAAASLHRSWAAVAPFQSLPQARWPAPRQRMTA